ncbi:uncharacterized protein N7482_004535 [Penicillium canariense]|uniref:Zn(2)-C6 fungal-type domain-containing protein n=1 Tax=Penicillium canariense TaxID=189055 RepID=A0A9W9LQ68_9EURO|nr:uncharacterized protein N7482_004535 [Penicillium canariense]KAJ5168941.1 hypothetical protein N7482_004535 [Penicillium canariense]
MENSIIHNMRMPPEERNSRSRTGCLECRKKHNKCDEKRPVCSFCSRRDFDCQYPSGLKWVRQQQPLLSRHRARRRNNASHRDGGGLLSRLPSLFVNDLFQSDEDRLAWEYYMRLVSPNVPALDGPNNPYRQLSFIALSSPVLLDTIVCIATEHMLNFGLGDVSTAAQHQQRMLRTIGQSLRLIESGRTCETGVIATTNHSDHEALFAAVILQGVVVAQSADGVLEPHVRCAAFLMETLHHFRRVPHNALGRMTVQRFAMVDVMLAISRQRRPLSPKDFVLHLPDAEQWDKTEPSFHEMTGCPQPLMCFLVRISHLACDVDDRLECYAPVGDILSQGYSLENELRAWGSHYPGAILEGCVRAPLDILTECFYWTAHLLLARRVFRDNTRSSRVQHLARTCFELMDQLTTGCGPDSSLPQPFYLAAREAITCEDRAWVRQKHESMTNYYREQQRNMAMQMTERLWEIEDQQNNGLTTDADGQIKSLDRRSCLFIF